ncbi:conserved hypothetical protein [Verticillium alfalfae VaMs.102]|uniref:Major facilitator superfamily (MFS) profile domain-containing protein n=1 Tax=Verticillium alfalfae (strain VaMs.102 / ATCC MYA-4576 / FGSC 10136) TaxID=526221 RepID=C9SWV8_VERA1|nr:conserved hypothetical protein [Verticillium alfalfae VaMs.102]EEY23499.1 conserved hypothetical protein [Verticillium alfalfae VaMs.102]
MSKSRSPSPTTATPVRSASDTDHQPSDVDAVALRTLTRKIDLRIIPLFIFLYTITFLDRVNIGNARLWHLEADLGMAGYDYNLAVLVFYIPYMLLEIPSNMLLNRLKPRYYIASLVFLWGLTITLAGFSTRFAHLLAARVLLGVFEAGMFPGCLFLLATWYPRHALLTRTALFLLANDIAGSVSGLLGAGLGALDGVRAASGWRWIFWLEGAFTCAAALLALRYVPDFPHREPFLADAERALWLARLEHDARSLGHEPMTPRRVLRALRDARSLAGGVLYLRRLASRPYSISVFTPTSAHLWLGPAQVQSAVDARAHRVGRRVRPCRCRFGPHEAPRRLLSRRLRDEHRRPAPRHGADGRRAARHCLDCQPGRR